VQVEQSMRVPNTLAVDAAATLGCHAMSIDDVKSGIARATAEGLTFIALGAGSNIIPQARIDRFVCLMRMRGIQIVEQGKDDIVVKIAAGENWHELVQYTIKKGWFGLENLSLIPGLVGAAPVQNIGAYGVELAQFVESVEVLDSDGQQLLLGADECRFEYRDSVFKTNSTLTIVAVSLRLSKHAQTIIDYPDLRAELETNEGSEGNAPTPAEVSQAVMAIRQRKLPDPLVVPNVGSFFKNPVIDQDRADELLQRYTHFKNYRHGDAVKLSAAQLIDEAGWKGQQRAGVTCWQRQPLVLINQDNASAVEVLNFAEAIRQDVMQKYAVQLELEPSLLS
jgi:UDP-N-acetylmuramate dehydrogenase